MTTREIQGHLRELYGIDVPPDLISVVTDAREGIGAGGIGHGRGIRFRSTRPQPHRRDRLPAAPFA